MAKNIFRTLKNYTHGFHSNATDEQIRVYDAKVAELTERIKADVEHAPEIIAEEHRQYEIKRYRAAFTKGYLGLLEIDAEWKAIDNVTMSLIDSKPLK